MPEESTRPATAPAAKPGRLIEIAPAGDQRWDRYVEEHAQGLVFHHSAWLRTLEREYGQRAEGLALEDGDGRLRGVLPLMATRGLPVPGLGGVGGRRIASLPRTPVAGPLADDRALAGQLAMAAVDRTPAGAQLQLKTAGDELDVAGLAGHPWRLTYVLTLPEPPAEVRFGNSRNHSRIKWAVNKALKEGVTVRHAASVDDVRRWYPLYLEAMRHHMVPPRALRFFEGMWEELHGRGMLRLLLAEHRGEPVAGAIVVLLGETAHYLFNGVRRDAFSLRPNDVLQWEAIRGCAKDGLRFYDLGEVVERHEGLAEFKRKWGADARRLHRYYHPAPAEPPEPGDAHAGRVALAAQRAWRAVPLRMTAVVGDRVYRYL